MGLAQRMPRPLENPVYGHRCVESNLHCWRPIIALIDRQPPLFTCRPSRLLRSRGRLLWRTPRRRSPIKFCPSSSCETAICARRCGKTTAAATDIYFHHRVEGNYSVPSRWINCQIHLNAAATVKTSLLLHLQHTGAEFARLPLIFPSLEEQQLIAVNGPLPFRAMRPKLTKLSNYRIAIAACGKITASLSVSNVYWREEIPANKARFAARCN